MLFHAPEFVFGFLPVTLLVFFLAARRGRRELAIAWLVAASLFFYAWGTAAHLALLAGSILFNYGCGLAIRARRRAGKERAAKAPMLAGVAANLALLGYMKYADFLVANLSALTGASFVAAGIVLPLAISFFTLQQIAYLVDVWRGRAEETSLLHYALFVSFFPQLIAGPIVHHAEMLPQFRRDAPFRFDAREFTAGLTIFLLGLFKKVALADSLAVYADPVFAGVAAGGAPTFYAAWSATLAFGFQIYFDFSAYSDMAIGLALMMSIRLPMNFDAPYKAASIIEFWRRWHITLSRFLRDYVYIPLGGNRHGEARRLVNLMLTMVIGGLWHGAAWTFVIWGGLHGAYLVFNHLWRRVFRGNAETRAGRPAGRVAGVALTFIAVTIAWVFFRAPDLPSALAMLEGMAGRHGALLPAQVVELVPALGWIATPTPYDPLLGGGTVLGFIELSMLLALSAGIVFFGRTLRELSQRQRLILIVATGAFTLQRVVFGGGASEFIYFRF